jgi:hypothetical protein
MSEFCNKYLDNSEFINALKDLEQKNIEDFNLKYTSKGLKPPLKEVYFDGDAVYTIYPNGRIEVYYRHKFINNSTC